MYDNAWCPALVFDKSLGISKKQAMKAFKEPSRLFLLFAFSHACFRRVRNRGERNNPVSYDIFGRAINFPSALCITEEQIERIVGTLRKVLKGE